MRNPQARAPEPNKPGERERRQGSREPGDPATKWVAIGSIAAVAAAAIALLAYAIPRPSVAPAPAAAPTAPVTAAYSPGLATYSPSYSSSPVPTAPAPSPSPAVIQASRPAGCDDAFGAINTYNKTAGSTANSEVSAASQAYQTLSADYLEANDQAVSSDISNLATDFDRMTWILQGEVSLSYPDAVQQTNSDIQTLDSACAIS
ncbi:MAG: hypothetical protein ABSA02_30125 [Trebonia sp.]|jgi:hypothetical protein